MPTTLDLTYPFAGRWLARNSPATRVPSHGTTQFASAFAIDFVGVDDAGRSAPFTATSLVRPEPPTRFVGFGRPVLRRPRGWSSPRRIRNPITRPSAVCLHSVTPSAKRAGSRPAGRPWPGTT